MRCAVAFALLMGPILSWAQVIEVRDEDGNPVPAAVIRNESGTARMTDLDGRLQLDSLLRQGDTLEIRSMGFGTRSLAMPGSTLDVEVELSAESVNLSEVVVAASQPARETLGAVEVSRISATSIARRVPANAATLLWRTGQVMIQQSQQGGGSPILRGFEANRILLVVDGVRLNNAIYRSGHLQNAMTVDPFAVGSTEVRHGAGSVQFGSDALGGVIHYHTRNPSWQNGTKARAQVVAGSVNRGSLFHADVETTRNNLASFTSVSHRRFGDLRMGRWRPHGHEEWGKVAWLVRSNVQGLNVEDIAEENEDENLQPGTAYHQTDVVQKLRYGTPKSHVELNLQHSTSSNVPRFDRLNDLSSDGGPKWAQWDYGPQQRSLAALKFRSQVQGLGNVTLLGAWQQVSETRLKARFGDSSREVQDEQVGVGSIQLDIDQRLGPWQLAYGGSWNHNNVNSEAWNERRADGFLLPESALTRYPNGGATMGSAAGYGGLSRRWGRWNMQAAARYTRGWLAAQFEDQPGLALPFSSVGYNRGALTGSATAQWQANGQFNAHATLASAFRNPNVDDVGKVRAKDGFAVVPSDSLMPERLYNAEMGAVWRSKSRRVSVQATGFETALLGAIQPVNSALQLDDGTWTDTIVVEGDTNSVQVNANTGRARIRGVQGQVRFKLNPGWRGRLTVNLTRGRDADNAPLSHIPPAFGACMVSRSWDWVTLNMHGHWSAAKRLEDYGPGSTDNLAEATSEGTPSWWTMGLDVEARLTTRTALSLGVHNALDRHYKVFASGISAAGRDLRIGWRWKPNE